MRSAAGSRPQLLEALDETAKGSPAVLGSDAIVDTIDLQIHKQNEVERVEDRGVDEDRVRVDRAFNGTPS